VRQLHDRDALLPRERQRRFLEAEGWVAWPGPAMADFLADFVAHNRMLEGGFVIEDRLVTLADIECPILYFVGEVDEIAPAAGVRAIHHAAPRAEVYEVSLRAGHFGLVVGSAATRTTWPVVANWARWRGGEGELPESVVRVEHDAEDSPAEVDRARYTLELAAGVGAGIVRSLGGTASRTVQSMRELTREAIAQLPRLARLEQIQPGTRISLGLLVDEQAARAPEDIYFLFGDRAYTQTAVKGRIDSVVRGLISVGVRQGEHVGVLMNTRPTALTLVAALSRLGAVAVLLRPDGEVQREAELGQVTRIIADPDHAQLATGRATVNTFVLGGGGGPRDLGVPVFDMEQIDPDEVELPAWYRPNPGRASDLAFILFTGEGEGTRMSRISNRRWAVSAFGTASAAALSGDDTVYSVTPLYHPSGLLMSIGGALVGGARLAMATAFDPATFWDEARRYGVTVASYTWTLLHDLVEAPPNPAEQHHPVRLFIGSGMPRGMWRRVEERFAPARVLEFYASTEVDAILVNVAGTKPGSMGRPLPGSAEVRIARYDAERARLIEGPDGLAQECDVDEVGMLLARVRPGARTSTTPLRGVFSAGDSWAVTGDLFRRDADGDYWRVDAASALIRTADGLVAGGASRDALDELPEVDRAVSYGVPVGDGETEVAVVAISLRDGSEVHATDLDAALRNIEPLERPAVVHVVSEIPVTTWYRPRTGPLRAAGIPPVDGDLPAWYRDLDGYYQPPTEAARRALAAA
jgi:putative long chain acyl-CoA synthase